MRADSMNQADSMNLFTDFWFMSFFKMIVDVTIEFKFFCFILQILFDSALWNADWLLAFKTTDFNVQIFNDDINQSFAESINIWFLFNQKFSMIIMCWSRWVINKDIILFLCSCIMIDVYRVCVIDFQSEISSYDQIDFDFDSDIDWISKHSHSSDIKDSSMKVMSVTSVFIRAKDLNIFSRLFKMTSTVNDLKSNESSDMLMKQNMSISLSITTLTKTDCFSNSLRFRASKLIQDSRVLYVLTSCIWSRVFFLNIFSLAESTFNILSFFHAEIEAEIAVVIVVKMLAIERVTWVVDVLRTNRAFNFVNQTLTCMQMLMNSFKFIVCSLIMTRWRSELILCWRSSSKVSLLYSSFTLSLWNFIQNSWKKILFWYSFKNCRWVIWCWLM